MITAFEIYKLKIESPVDIIVHRLNKLIYGKQKANEIKFFKTSNSLRKKYFKNGLWNFNGIILPEKPDDPPGLITLIYRDTLLVYCAHQDNYDSKLVDKLDPYLPEGTYCYKNDQIDVTVKPGDIVIDAGAWIGDFSAYASKKGAFTYAFEPCKNTVKYLNMTSEFNKNITVVEYGLGDKKETLYLTHCDENSGANKVISDTHDAEEIHITTIDCFVAENNIERIDFIKADIEGFERKMLLGAKETLKKFAPKLAICTYHLPDDPEVLANIILEANPNYIIVQKKMKLYAMVK